MTGFGTEEFGQGPFGRADWAKAVLWDELPEADKQADLKSGGWFYKFVTCLMPSFRELVASIDSTYRGRISPRTVRPDLIRYLAYRFGIDTDLAESQDYQRMNIEIAARWRLIKGARESYEILCAIHGFNVVVHELWWNGISYSVIPPYVENEEIGVVS